MEESGRKYPRPRDGRLLTRLLGVLCISLSAVFPLASLEVDIFVSSFEIAAGDPLVVSFTVHGSEPGSTNLSEPAVPASFLPSSSRKELAQLEATGVFSGSRTRATVITREWIPSERGNFSLGPFTVSSGTESVTLPPLYITVISPQKTESAALRWAPSDTGAKTGTPLRIVLEGLFDGEAESVFCAAPENALLSAASVPAKTGPQSGDAGTGWLPVAAYDWTPLVEGSLSLPSAILEYTAPSGSVRKIASENRTVSVSAGAPVSGPAPVTRMLGKAFILPPAAQTVPVEAAAAFPPEGLPPDLAVLLSAVPWQPGNYARILQELRLAEYRRLFPSRYRTVRRAAEESLSLGQTLEVPPAAWKFWSVTGFAALLSLSLLLRLAGARSAVLRGLSSVGLSVSLLLAIFAVNVYTRDMQPAGVVTGGALLTVPEPNSTVIAVLAEGRTVQVRRRAGDWLFVSTDSSLEGWLPAAGVLQYTLLESDK